MQTYKSDRSKLVINHIYSYYNNARCYSEDKFEVISSHPLSQEDLRNLFDAGFLGFGQDFYIRDYNPEPAGYDESRLFDTETKQYVPNVASIKQAYYKYYTEVTCDSGD